MKELDKQALSDDLEHNKKLQIINEENAKQKSELKKNMK